MFELALSTQYFHVLFLKILGAFSALQKALQINSMIMWIKLLNVLSDRILKSFTIHIIIYPYTKLVIRKPISQA